MPRAAPLAIDTAAWESRWRERCVAEKALLSLGLLAVAMASRSALLHLVVIVCVAVALTRGAGVPLARVMRAWALPMSFVAVGVLAVMVSVGSPAPDAVWSWSWLSVSESSLQTALHAGGRSLAATAAVLVLALTTPMSDLLHSLGKVGVPSVLLDIAAVVYRMIFGLLGAQASLRQAQTARLGYSTRSAALRSTGGLFAIVLIRAWTSAQRLERGLAGRGYSGAMAVTTSPRTLSRPFVAGTVVLLVLLSGGVVVSHLGA